MHSSGDGCFHFINKIIVIHRNLTINRVKTNILYSNFIKNLYNSKKSSNFAADFSRLLDYKWEDI